MHPCHLVFHVISPPIRGSESPAIQEYRAVPISITMGGYGQQLTNIQRDLSTIQNYDDTVFKEGSFAFETESC